MGIENNPLKDFSVITTMKRSVLTTVCLIVIRLALSGQAHSFEGLKGDIAYYSDMMVNADLDKHRIRADEALEMALDTFLSIKGSYNETLDSIPWLTIVHGNDFRIVTWQLKISTEEYKYGGFIQWEDRIVHLRDTRPFTNGSSFSTYTPAGWYGCMYYQIVPFQRDGVTYYALMGYNAENSSINTKVTDILDLTGAEPRLGLPVFIGKDEPMTRIMMTYADISNAHMGYDAKLGGIVHDHIESLAGIGPSGEPLPVSDGSMEGWILKKGNWVYQEKVYDVKQDEPPMSDDRRDRKEDKDILGRPKKQ
jgi:hypothetical protein